MKKAHRLFTHTAVALSLAFAAGSAQAIPITFAFTATVRDTTLFDADGNSTLDPSRNGQAVTGAIVIESEGLLRTTFADEFGSDLTFFNPALISSTLSIGGLVYDVGGFANDFGGLHLFDSNGPVPCGDGCSDLLPDRVNVSHGSTNQPFGDPNLTGVFDSRSLSLGWTDPNDALGLVDLSGGFDPLDVLSIPVVRAFGAFSEQVIECTDGLCLFTKFTVTNFEFGSLTVSTAATTVPEPGTLSLFLLGLLVAGGKKWRSGRDSNPRPPA